MTSRVNDQVKSSIIGAILCLCAVSPLAGQGPGEDLPLLLAAVERDLAAFWSANRHLGGETSLGTPVPVISYDRSVLTPCGRLGPGNAYYCRRNRTIYLERRFLETEFRLGYFAPAVVLAHEWGHAVQHRFGAEDPYPIRTELQADCYAGAFAAASDLERKDVDEALDALFRAGSTDFLWLDPKAHGSGGERIDAFWWGYQNGPRACLRTVFMRKAGGSVPKFDVPQIPAGSEADLFPPRLGGFRLIDIRQRAAGDHYVTPAVEQELFGYYLTADNERLTFHFARFASASDASGWIRSNNRTARALKTRFDPSCPGRPYCAVQLTPIYDRSGTVVGHSWSRVYEGPVPAASASATEWANAGAYTLVWTNGVHGFWLTGPGPAVLEFARLLQP